MKKTILLTIIILFGLSLAYSAEDWYAAQEETSHNYIKDLKSLLLARENEYYPDYTQAELEAIMIKENSEENMSLAGRQASALDPAIPSEAWIDGGKSNGTQKPPSKHH